MNITAIIEVLPVDLFINIIDSYDEFNNLVMLAKNDDEILLKKASGMRDFVLNQNNIYFDKLKNIIGG